MTINISKETEDKFLNAANGYKARASKGYIEDFRSTANSVRVRDEYTRNDYEHFRPSESRPKSERDIITKSNEYYYRIGLVRNVIDLMSDFSIKGIDWSHQNRQVQAFMRRWFENVNGFQVSERFCNYLLRMGNNCIYTNKTKIPDELSKEWRMTKGEEFDRIMAKNRVIPSSYVFLNILSLQVVHRDIGKPTASRVYLITSPFGTSSEFVRGFNGKFSRESFSGLPEALLKQLKDDKQIILTSDDIKMHHYKKDDWKLWAEPIIGSILEPLQVLEKMHLADMSALDGAISCVRHWTVGYIDETNINNSFIPNEPMLNKVEEMIHNNIMGGVLDIVSGPELKFTESATQAHNFLGPEKYEQIMTEIYDGLGVPPSLTGGAAAGGGGFTNNFISMKVLIERLNYLRNQLTKFWNSEAREIQKAMGFSSPAKIQFDDAILSDEAQYKKLLIELYDRDIVSKESLREEFNMFDNIETSRVRREMNRSDKGKDPQKSGPYSNPMWVKQLYSDLVKQGKLDPEEINLDIELEEEVDQPNPGEKGGRPIGAGDQTKRKDKIVRPRTTASDFYNKYNLVSDQYNSVTDILNPTYLQTVGKQYIRDLTNVELDCLENLKMSVLTMANFKDTITNTMVSLVCQDLPDISVEKRLKQEIIEQSDRKITAEDKRNAICATVVLSKMSKN